MLINFQCTFEFCDLPSIENQNKCILHLDDSEKDLETFRSTLLEKILDKPIKLGQEIFRGIVFPDAGWNPIFRENMFDETTYFNFAGAKFYSALLFPEKTIFKNCVYFGGNFTKGLDLFDIIFEYDDVVNKYSNESVEYF